VGVCSVTRMVVKLAIAAAVATLFSSNPSDAQIIKPAPDQIIKPAPKAKHVEITQGPTLESAHDDVAIIRWTTNNPGGDDDHYAVVHYGTDPKDLSQTAKNHIRLNQSHPETIFRVRMDGLKPQTTYYYKVTSMGYDGVSDGVESSVNHFTTAAPGQVTSAFPPPD
jgi:phosphodiesterase/alkaline phosphatase D-like protein